MLPQFRARRLGHRQRVAIVEDAAAHPVGDDRSPQGFRHRAQCIPGMQCAAADHDDRVLGGGEELRGLVHGAGVGSDGRHRRRGFDGLDVRLESEHVHRRLDRDGAGHAGPELVECVPHPLRRLRRVFDARGPLGESTQDRALIGDFVQQPVALADCGRGELSGDREHRRAGPPGGGERRGGVQDAGPGHDDIDADLRARLRITESHVCRRLLVAGVDDTNAVALVMQRVEQRVELDARKPEQGVDAVRDERAHDRPGGGHSRHHVIRPRSRGSPPETGPRPGCRRPR